jgi:hypothetical protein
MGLPTIKLSTSLCCTDYHQSIPGSVMISKTIWCSCSWCWVVCDLLFSSWDLENFWIIVSCAQYKTRSISLSQTYDTVVFQAIDVMPSSSPSLTWIGIYQYDLYVISCHPNFWLPFIFIHADRHSAKHCNKLVMASLNQYQECFMNYYLKI